VNPRIQIMLDSREIEQLPASDEEVVGMWRKATTTFRSSAVPGLDDDSRFTLTYQAALQGATAVVRAAGYRVKGDDNHHIAYATVAALGLGGLSDAARDLNVIRQTRHKAVYDWEGTVHPKQLGTLRDATVRLLREADLWLRTQRESLAATLAPLTIPD